MLDKNNLNNAYKMDYEEIKEQAKGEIMNDLNVPSVNFSSSNNNSIQNFDQNKKDNSDRIRSLEELEKLF